MPSHHVTVDVDGETAAWVESDRVRLIALDGGEPSDLVLDQSVLAVLADDAGGEFWLADRRQLTRLRWSAEQPTIQDTIPLPAGVRWIARGSRRPGTRASWVAHDGRHLLGSPGSGDWSIIARLDTEPAALAYQQRSGAVLIAGADGQLIRVRVEDGVRHEAATAVPIVRDAAYDDVLGRLWVVPGDAHLLAMIHVDPWPPRLLGSVVLPDEIDALRLSPNGEWLAFWRDGAPGLSLYNVAGDRLIAPTQLHAARPLDAAFTPDNDLLVLTADRQLTTLPLPARLEARAIAADLEVDVFWQAKIRPPSTR